MGYMGHFVQRLQPFSLSTSTLQAPEQTDGGGGAMKEGEEEGTMDGHVSFQPGKNSSRRSIHPSICNCPSVTPLII